MPASISALLAALQPILTAALAPILLRERIGAKQWLGIVLGFIGIIVVLSPKLAGVAPGQLGAVAMPLLINIIAMLAVTAGTFYQKRYIHSGDLRTVTILRADALVVSSTSSSPTCFHARRATMIFTRPGTSEPCQAVRDRRTWIFPGALLGVHQRVCDADGPIQRSA